MSKFSLMILLVLGFGCTSPDKSIKMETSMPEYDPTKKVITDTSAFYLKPKKAIDYIIYGMFCGECYRECARMYKYVLTGAKNKMYVDHTDSYFKGKEIICKDEGEFPDYHRKAMNIVNNIPDILFSSYSQRFGCPDCNDGCGYYFEYSMNGIIRKFTIDTDPRNIDSSLANFTSIINKALINTP